MAADENEVNAKFGCEKRDTLTELCAQIKILNNSDRATRLRALKKVRALFEDNLCEDLICDELKLDTCKVLLSSLQDKQESCRELAANIFKLLLGKSRFTEILLPYLVPVIVKRLTHDKATEQSEEVRLLLVILLKIVAQQTKISVEEYVELIVSALRKSALDSYPEIKKESCFCMRVVAESYRNVFFQYSEVLVDPLIHCLGHQHWKVRQGALDAIGYVILYGSSQHIDKLYPHLTHCLLDDSPKIRLSVTSLVGQWMIHLPDRNSYYSRFIPIVLTSLTDDVLEVSNTAETLWHSAGKQYEIDNKTELEKQLDWEKLTSDHHPEKDHRPPLGCRVLVSKNLALIYPAVFNDLNDWMRPVRHISARLLYKLVLNAEEGSVRHFSALINGIINGCKGKETAIVDLMIKSAEVLGYFVPIDLWSPIIMQQVSDIPCLEVLQILSALIRGTKQELDKVIPSIANAIEQPFVSQSNQLEYQREMLVLLKILLDKQQLSRETCLRLFNVVITTDAMKMDQELRKDVNECLVHLCGHVDVKSISDLCVSFFDETLQNIIKMKHYDDWTCKSTEWLMFNSLLSYTGFELILIIEIILPIWVSISQTGRDHQMKFSTLQSVAQLYENTEKVKEEISIALIQDVIVPNLRWTSGRASATLRATALVSLSVILQNTLVKNLRRFYEVLNFTVSPVLNLLEDDNKTSRSFCCKILRLLLSDYPDIFSAEGLEDTCFKVLARMDDVELEIRVLACEVVGQCFKIWTTKYNMTKAQAEIICTRLMIFMDDSDTEFQRAALDALKIVAKYDPQILRNDMYRIQNKRKIQDLEDIIQALDLEAG